MKNYSKLRKKQLWLFMAVVVLLLILNVAWFLSQNRNLLIKGLAAISPAKTQPVVIAAPTSGANLIADSTVKISWTLDAFTAANAQTINIYVGQSQYNCDGGKIATLAGSASSYSWKIVSGGAITFNGVDYICVAALNKNGLVLGYNMVKVNISTPPSGKKCSLCVYDSVPVCDQFNTTAKYCASIHSKNSCLNFKNKPTDDSMCQWDSSSGICEPSDVACFDIINPVSDMPDCVWADDPVGDGYCLSRFKAACIERQAEQGKQYDSFLSTSDPGNINAKTSMIKNFISSKNCKNLDYYEAMHGNGSRFDCPVLSQTAVGCICSGGSCNITKFSCAVGQNYNSVQAMGEVIRKAVCATKDKNTSVTVTVQQATASDICQTPETLTVTCDKFKTSFVDCKSMPGFCYAPYEYASCSNYSSAGVYQNDSEYMCCGPQNDAYFPGKKMAAWVPADTLGSAQLCPGDTAVSGTSKGFGANVDSAEKAFVADYEKALASCSGKNQTFLESEDDVQITEIGVNYYRYSLDWQCITHK